MKETHPVCSNFLYMFLSNLKYVIILSPKYLENPRKLSYIGAISYERGADIYEYHRCKNQEGR